MTGSSTDVAQTLVDRETERALSAHQVELVTLVILIRGARGRDFVRQIPCRPIEREAVLAQYGIDINRPTRGPRHAFAWVDNNGRLHVGGTSEKGKERLRLMYGAVVTSGEENIVLI